MASGLSENVPVLLFASYKRTKLSLCARFIAARMMVNAWSIAAGSITVSDCAITAISGRVSARASSALSPFPASPCAIKLPISSTNKLISASLSAITRCIVRSANVCPASHWLKPSVSCNCNRRKSSSVKSVMSFTGAEKLRKIDGIGRVAISLNINVCSRSVISKICVGCVSLPCASSSPTAIGITNGFLSI